ncbi:MAG: hypothetical protein IKL84_02680 [Clostridia bacterium]|nr:hypothetical protein [Clostridia bacterium]
MSTQDNEYYQGVQDCEPTIKPEQRHEEFFSSTESYRAVGDAPPTCQTEDIEARAADTPSRRGLRKIAKMLKLTAAAVVTAAVATGVLGSSTIGITPREFTLRWPHWTYLTFDVNESAYTTVYNSLAKESNIVQFSIEGEIYRLEDTSKSLSFIWSGSRFDRADLLVYDANAQNSYSIILSKQPYDEERISLDNAYGTISSTTGDLFYIETISHVHRDTGERVNTSAELSALMHQLLVRSHIAKGSANEWGKVLLGDTMYSDLHENWSGMSTCGQYDDSSNFSFYICDKARKDIKLDDHIATLSQNDITWKAYLQEGFSPHPDEDYTDDIIWLVPDIEKETAILAVQQYTLQEYSQTFGISGDQFDIRSAELLTRIMSEFLTNIHIAPDDWR